MLGSRAQLTANDVDVTLIILIDADAAEQLADNVVTSLSN
jgi:hypothetical protein